MGSIIKWPGLISLQEDIATTKDFINEYHEGKITRDRFRACINAVYQVHNWAQLVPRIIFEGEERRQCDYQVGTDRRENTDVPLPKDKHAKATR